MRLQKKNTGTSQSSSVDGTSESTESQSAYAPPSISKIKRANAKDVSLEKNAQVLQGLESVLANNKSPRYKQLLVENLAKKGYDANELWASADKVNPPDETEIAMRDVSAKANLHNEEVLTPQEAEHITSQGGKIPEKVKIVTPKEAPEGAKEVPFVADVVMEHLINSSVGIGEGLSSIKEGIGKLTLQPSEANLEGATDIAKGVGHTVFGAANIVVPAMATFGLGTTALHKMPAGAKEVLAEQIIPSTMVLPKEKRAEAFDKAIDLPFTLVTSIAEASGYERGKEGRKYLDNLMEIGDLVVPVLGHKVGTGVAERVKSMKDLKDLTNRIIDEKASEQDIQDFKDINDGIKDLTPEDIQNAAEQKLEGIPVKNDEIHTQIAELQTKIRDDSFAELPPEVQSGLLKDVADLEQQLKLKEGEEMMNDMADADNQAKAIDLDEKIAQAEASMEGQSESVKASIQNSINDLKAQRDAIQVKTTNEVDVRQQARDGETLGEGNAKEPITPEESEAQRQADLEAEKQDVIEFKIQEAIAEGDLVEGGIEEKLARENLAKRYDNAEELRKDSEAMYQMEEADMVEFLVDGKTYKTAKNEYTIKKDGSELTILDKNGREPSPNTRLKIIKDYEDKFDYTKGESAFEGLKPGDVLESEADKLVSEKSENPAEIIEAHERLISERPFEKGDAIDNAISENIGKVKQKGRGGYNNFGDKNNVQMNKAKAYFSESKGEPIDTLAQRISEDTGLNVTTDDIISFIDRHPNGISDYTKTLKNPLLTSLKDRFKQITGLTLNDRVLKSHAKKTLSKEDYELISKDYENREQAQKEFYDAVERGEAELPREVSDAIEVKEGEGKTDAELVAEFGEQPASMFDVAKRHSDGDAVFGFHEQGGEPVRLNDITEIQNFPEDMLMVVPKEVMNEKFVEDVAPPKTEGKSIEQIHQEATSNIDSNELTGNKKDKSLLNRLYEADIPKEGKDAIKGKGLEYTELSNETAKGVADGIIDDYKATYGENWVDPLVAFASQKQTGIPLSINAIALGRVTEHFTILEKGTEVMSEKLAYAEKAAEVADIMDTLGRDFGRFNSAIQEVYKMTPLGVKARMKRKIDNQNNANLDAPGRKGDKTNREKVKQAYDELNKLKESLTEEIDKKVSEKMNEVMEQLPKEKRSYAKKAIDVMDQLEKDILSGKVAFASIIPPPVVIAVLRTAKLLVKGGMKVSEAIERAIDKYKSDNKDADYDFESIKPKFKNHFEKEGLKDPEAKTPKEELSSIEKLVAQAQGKNVKPILPKEAKVIDKAKAEKERDLTKGAKLPISETPEQVLDRIFPKKRMESASKRKKMHEKIIEANQAGALNYEQFEKLFYEKFGLIDADNGVVKEFLNKAAERIHNAADGGLKEREYTKVLDFLENHRKQGLTEWFTTPFYANILSGYETHMNNSQFNMFSGIAQTTMLMAKNPKHAKFIATKMLSSFAQSSIEAKNVMLTGERFGSEASASSLAERRAKQGFGISAYYKIPGRLLKSADVLFNTPLKRMKEAELMLRIANDANKLLPKDQQKTRKEIEADVNDIMFDTTSRKAEALEQAKKDIVKLEGENVDFNDKRIVRDVKLRQFEIMERTRPEDKYLQYGIDYNSVKEQAQDFANRGLLMTKPVGSLGAVSTVLHNLGDGVPLTKFAITTFVDVPLNLANMMIDKSPLGLVRMGMYEATGKRGLLTTKSFAEKNKIKTELTPDQRREAWQRASAYSAGLVAFGALTTMEYTDDKGKKRKVLEVTSDGYGDFKKNLQLKSATGGEYKEFTADFMGFEFSYKYNSVLAPILTPLGAVADYEKYKDKTPETEMDTLSKVAFGFMSYMDFVSNQANLQGFRDLFGESSRNIDPEKMGAKELDKFQKMMTKTIRSMIVPNFAVQGNKDIKGLMDKAEKMPTEWYHYAIKDVPFVESIMEARFDHYGREVKSQFHLPIVLVPDKLNMASEDPYYKMDLEHKYNPSYVSRRTVFDGENEVELTQEQLRVINKRRGEIVRQKLDAPQKMDGDLFNTFIANVPSSKKAEMEKLRGKTFMQILGEMDNEAYAEKKNELFKSAEIQAKSELLGFDVEQKAEDRKDVNKNKATEKKFLTKALLKLAPKKQ